MVGAGRAAGAGVAGAEAEVSVDSETVSGLGRPKAANNSDVEIEFLVLLRFDCDSSPVSDWKNKSRNK